MGGEVYSSPGAITDRSAVVAALAAAVRRGGEEEATATARPTGEKEGKAKKR